MAELGPVGSLAFVAVLRPLIPLLLVALWPNLGTAKRTEDFKHSYEQVWRSAIRLIRVDQGFPIRDRDKEVGYFMFDYQDNGRGHPGSVEVVEVDKRGTVKVVIQIPSMPSYIERMLLDKLKRKLDTDYGQPPNRAKKEPSSEEPEEDGDEEDPKQERDSA